MATKRSKTIWVAPRSGGYSAVTKDTSGSGDSGNGHYNSKQPPPKGPGAASRRAASEAGRG